MQDMIERARVTGAISYGSPPRHEQNPASNHRMKRRCGHDRSRLEGFEVWHPYHTSYDVAYYLKLCTDNNLLSSSRLGHPPANDSRRQLTNWPVRYSRALLERCGVAVAKS